MKRLSVILGCLAFALCPLVQAQPAGGGGQGGQGGPGGGRGGRQGMQQRMQKMWEQVDREEMFGALDANGDGNISKDEFDEANLGEIMGGAMRKAMMAGRQGGQQGQGGDPAQMFKRLDKDGDGKITAEEFPRGPEAFERLAQRLDKDGDGALSIEEMAAMRGQGRGGQGGREGRGGKGAQGGFVKRFDKDEDGKVSAEEFPRGKEAFEKLLERADKDGDGLISTEEMNAVRGQGRKGGR